MTEHTELIALGRRLAEVYSVESEIQALEQVIAGYHRDMLKSDLDYRSAMADRERCHVWQVTRWRKADKKAERAHEACEQYVNKIQELRNRVEALKLQAEEAVHG